MLRHGIFLLIVAGLTAVSRPVEAATDPVEAFPDSTSVLLRFKDPTTTIKRAVRIATGLDKEFGQTIQQMSNGIGALISNPKGVGVDRKGDWWLAVFLHDDAPPGVVFAIPASDADAMKRALSQGGGGQRGGVAAPGSRNPAGGPAAGRPGFGARNGYQFVDISKYVLYTTDQAAVQAMQARINGTGRSIKTLIDAESNGVMLRGDLSVYVNVRQLRERYKVELEAAGEEVDAALKDLPNFAPKVPDVDLEPVFKMYGRMFQGLLQGVQDAESFTAGIAVRSRGVEMEEYLRVKADSPTDRFLQSSAPSELAALDKLPPNKLMYVGMHCDITALTKWGMELTSAMLKDEKVKQQMQEVLKAFQEVKFGGMVMGFGLGDLEHGALQTVTFTEVTPVEPIRDLSRKTTQALGQMSFAGIKQQMELKPDAETYGQHSADILTLKTEVDAQADPLGIQKQIMSMMYGPEGMTQRIVYLNNGMVQTMGGGRKAMEEALKSLEAPSKSSSDEPANPTLDLTRSQLSAKANLVWLMDVPGLVSDALGLMSSGGGQLPVAIPEEELKKLSGQRSYLGCSVTTEPAGLRAKTFVPKQQIESIYKLVGMFRTMFQQFQPQQFPPGQFQRER